MKKAASYELGGFSLVGWGEPHYHHVFERTPLVYHWQQDLARQLDGRESDLRTLIDAWPR